MLEERVIPVDFGQGVDTKTDSKQVVAGKFLRLENGVFTAPKRVAKRNGYAALTSGIAGGSSLSSPKLLTDFNDELVCADSGYLYAYSASATKWINRGPYTSVEHSRKVIDQKYAATGFADCAVLNNYVLYVWSACNIPSSGTASNYVLASVLDTSTNTWLDQGHILFSDAPGFSATAGNVKAVLMGGSQLAVFYWKGTTQTVVCQTVTIASGAVTYGTATAVTTNLTTGGTYGTSSFDVMATSTGAAIIYQYAAAGVNAGVQVSTISTVPAVVASVQFASANYVSPVHVNVDSANGNIWAYWCESTGGFAALATSLIKYAVVDSSLASVLAATTAATFGAPLFVPTNLSALKTSTTGQTLYFGYYAATAATVHYVDVLKYVTLTSAGVAGTVTTLANGVTPISRVITNGSNNYVVAEYRGTVASNGTTGGSIAQPTFFLLWLNSTATYPPVVGRFEYGTVRTLAMSGGFYLGRRIQSVPNLILLSGQKYLFTYGAAVQEFQGDSFASVSDSLSGIFMASLDFNGSNAYQDRKAGDLAILNGSCLHNYDGQTCNEFHFHLIPELTTLGQTINGSIADGDYSYLVIFQWIDAQGNLHQSAPSEALSITVAAGGGTAAVIVAVGGAYLTQKTGVSAAIYRTEDGGAVYHLVSNPLYPLTVDPTAAYFTFTDTLADSSIVGNPEPYTFPGSPVLENGTPPPSMLMLSRNNRLWFVNAEDGTVWFTKSFSAGNGLSPSPFLTQQIDKKLGATTALAEMDDKLVYLKSAGFCVQSGDGPDDTGAGSTLSQLQFVPSDVGCDQSKSVIVSPDGVMFHSPNGIYLFSRSSGVSYIGAEVESYNSQTITAATFVPGKSQIRFLCSSGKTLVYDYIFKQWSTFTNHTGAAAANFQSLYCYVTTAGTVFQESTTTYLDNATAYALLAQTSWLHLGSVQGFQRVRRLALLGDFANGSSASHKVQISAAYDFSTTFGTAIAFTFGAASGSGVFQYRERLPQQKCDAVSLLIEEVTTSNSGEYIDLSNISFEAAIKRGVNKLGAAYSVG